MIRGRFTCLFAVHKICICFKSVYVKAYFYKVHRYKWKRLECTRKVKNSHLVNIILWLNTQKYATNCVKVMFNHHLSDLTKNLINQVATKELVCEQVVLLCKIVSSAVYAARALKEAKFLACPTKTAAHKCSTLLCANNCHLPHDKAFWQTHAHSRTLTHTLAHTLAHTGMQKLQLDF